MLQSHAIRPTVFRCTWQFQQNNTVPWLVAEIFVRKFCCQAIKQLECGPMPNVMVALPNIGGALCSTPQSLANAHY